MNTEFGDPMLEVRTEGSLVSPFSDSDSILKGTDLRVDDGDDREIRIIFLP